MTIFIRSMKFKLPRTILISFSLHSSKMFTYDNILRLAAMYLFSSRRNLSGLLSKNNIKLKATEHEISLFNLTCISYSLPVSTQCIQQFQNDFISLL